MEALSLALPSPTTRHPGAWAVMKKAGPGTFTTAELSSTATPFWTPPQQQSVQTALCAGEATRAQGAWDGRALGGNSEGGPGTGEPSWGSSDPTAGYMFYILSSKAALV